MAPVLAALLTFLVTAQHIVHAASPGQGPQYELLMGYPWKTFIQNVSLSLKVPAVPNPQQNLVNIYPSLIALYKYHQPILASYGTPSSYQCRAAAGQWCAYASVFDYNSQTTTKGAIAVVKPGDVLQYNINLVSGGQYLETISRAGQVLSQTQAGSVELPIFFELMSTCAVNAANLLAYTYSNIAITLALPYPNYIKEATISKDRVTTSPASPYTTDGGVTWKIDTVSFQAAVCTV